MTVESKVGRQEYSGVRGRETALVRGVRETKFRLTTQQRSESNVQVEPSAMSAFAMS